MLDDDHRVSLITKIAQAVEQHFVIARVQPDGWFVEDVNDVDQTAADLSGKANPLALAARKRRRRSLQREVIQPAPQQETGSTADLFQSFAGDVLLRFGQVERLEELPRGLNIQRADFGDVQRGGSLNVASTTALPFSLRADRFAVGCRAVEILLAGCG